MHYFSFQSAKGFPPFILGTQEMEIADIRTYIRTTVDGTRGKVSVSCYWFWVLGGVEFFYLSLTIEKNMAGNSERPVWICSLGGEHLHIYIIYAHYVYRSVVVGLA